MFSVTDKESLFAITIDEPQAPEFKITRLTGTEAISTLFEFELQMVTASEVPDLQTLIGKKVTLAIRSDVTANPHYYHGIFSEIEQQDRTNNLNYYRAVLVPRMWKTTLNKTNDVATSVTPTDLITQKLKEASFTSDDFLITMTQSYETKDFMAQFEESHFAFISRTMEYRGIYYFFEHGAAKEDLDVLHIVDHTRAHPVQAVDLVYTPRENIKAGSTQGLVTNLFCKSKLHPASVTLTGYNPRKANLLSHMRNTANVPGTGIGDVMEFDGKPETTDEIQLLSKIYAEQIACQSKVFSAKAFTAGIRSGYFVQISKHWQSDFNTKLLVTRVAHTGTQSFAAIGIKVAAPLEASAQTTYECSFDAIVAETQFRPARVTPKPKIVGLLNAKIDPGANPPTGNSSAVFENGQYKVQPLFIKENKSPGNGSSLIRMLTPNAGSQSGALFGLHGEIEVLLGFVNGDPDLPVIVGAAFNSEDKSVLDPSNKSEHVIRTKSGTSILFDDSTKKEKVLIFSQGSSIVVGKEGNTLLQNFTDDLFSVF
jgi:type VI secretion system secreted protein VgrG